MGKKIRIHLDFETYSEADLPKIGAYKYAMDSTTDVLCAAYAVEDGPILEWLPNDEYPFSEYAAEDIEFHCWNSQFERLITQFVLTKQYGWPRFALRQFVCVSAQARNCAAGPSKLETAALFFDRPDKKDMKGHAHMKYMCKPAPEKEQLDFLHKNAKYAPTPDRVKRCHHTADNIQRLSDYCGPDVAAERGIFNILPAWRDEDLEDFWICEEINDIGLIVDVKFAAAAVEFADEEKGYLSDRIYRLTNGRIETPRQFAKLTAFILDACGIDHPVVELMKWYDNGFLKYSLDADVRGNIIAELDRDEYFLPHHVAELIRVLDDAGNSSISKYQAILDKAVIGFNLGDPDARIHGCYMYAGASQSGRYSSVGIQVHNLVRDVPKMAVKFIKAFKQDDIEFARALAKEWAQEKNAKLAEIPNKTSRTPEAAGGHIDVNGEWADPGGKKSASLKRLGSARMTQLSSRKISESGLKALSAVIRPTITGAPDGSFDLAWSDWAAIEARALPWLANDPRADDLLALFRRGEDVYLHDASKLTGRKITVEDEFERQAFGKVPRLSLGYGGAEGAFMAMSRNYGVTLEERRVTLLVRDWREDNAWAADRENGFWAKLKAAAINAMLRPGSPYTAGRVMYRYDPDALDGMGALFCTLPSKRDLVYPGAQLNAVRSKWSKRDELELSAAKSAWRPKKDATTWPRVRLWHGLLAENVTQAVCADLLRLALWRAKRARLIVCGHTHDEIMIETPDPERDAPKLVTLMIRKPGWQGDDALPLSAEAGYGFRYKVKTQLKVAA